MLRQLFLSRRGARTLTIPRRNVIAPGLWHPLTLRSISKPRFSGSQHALFSAPLPQLSTISGGLGCGIWARTFAARTGPGNEDGEHKSSPKNDSQPTGDDREANEEKKQAKEDGIDQPVDAADISSRLQKKAIPAEDATAYAAKLLGAKFTSPRKLAALTETKLDKLEFAMGDQAVALEAFQEWKEELTSAASERFTFPSGINTPAQKHQNVLKILLADVSLPQLPELYPESGQRRLGPFRKSDLKLPCSGGFIDMRFFHFPTTPPLYNQIHSQLSAGSLHAIFINMSGAGKTALGLRLASEFFAVYMDCSGPDPSNDPTRDRNYVTLLEEVSRYHLDNPGNVEGVRQFAKHRISLEYTARWMYLQLLESANPGKVTPLDFLVGQLNGGQDVVGLIIGCLRALSPNDLADVAKSLMQELTSTVLSDTSRCSNNGLAVQMIDEANVASEYHLRGIFRSQDGQPRAFLTPLLTTLSSFPAAPSSLTMGTAFTLGNADQVKSAINKPNFTYVYTNFPVLTKNQVVEDMQACLDLDGCDITEAPKFAYLVDRPRVSAQIPHLISMHFNKSGATTDKQQVLDTAVSQSVERTKKDLKNKLQKELERPQEQLSQGLHGALSELYIGAKWFRGRCQVSKNAHDLVHIGIARLLEVDEDQGWFELSGLISQEAVVEVLEADPQKRWSPVVEAAQRLTPGAQGEVGEDIVGRELVGLSNSDLTVADFARKFLPTGQLPEWANTAKIKLNRWGLPTHYGCDDLPSFLEKAADKDAFFCNALVSPSTAARPDGVAVCPITDSTFFSVLFSSKLMSEPMREKDIEADRLSTELSKLYFLRNGKCKAKNGDEVNVHVRARCMAALSRLGSHVGSLRVHCVLPRAGKKGVELSCVQGNDIIIYISEDNLSNMFCSDNAEALAKVLDNVA